MKAGPSRSFVQDAFISLKIPQIVKNTVGSRLLAAWMRESQVQAQGLRPDETPLRDELFSREHMKHYGGILAKSHGLARDSASEPLLPRLRDNEAVLLKTRDLVAEAAEAKLQISPAGEWLLDNFHLIEEQIRTAKRHLPPGYSRSLPRLGWGPSKGLPRVYDIALEIVSHGDGRLDPESMEGLVATYQQVTALKLGELWAIPIMLRLALIENLRRVATRVALQRADRNLAGAWADKMAKVSETEPKGLVLVVADMARSHLPMSSSFVAELTRRLQGRGSALALPLTWISQWLSEAGLSIERLVEAEGRMQAADQVSIGNSIGSLRLLGGMDWRDFVETHSATEHVLREDPAGAYSLMEFSTRDLYRHQVERMARRDGLPEEAVAQAAIELANSGKAAKGGDAAEAHVGYYLIDQGLAQLGQKTGHSSFWAKLAPRKRDRFPLWLYLGAAAGISLGLAGAALKLAESGGATPVWAALAWAMSLLAGSQLALDILNSLATLLRAPHFIPRMDFSSGIPAHAKTLVVVPAMIDSADEIARLAEALEVRYLGNQDPQLRFALLSDFRDAAQERMPADEKLLQLAKDCIERLNEKYGQDQGDIFYLFQRPRRFNSQENLWMGHERKRGKLADLNAWLRGGDDGAFSLIVGDGGPLRKARYVITLDADTQLPRDSASQMVGAMAHPLNQARLDPVSGRVLRGYGILQPRVNVSLPGTNRSLYARLFGGDPGIDPYTRSVSDVYEDLFHEGSFIGKGIYDIEAFERSLQGRLPDNRILSHDLLEGCFARSGLLSDVSVYEEAPSDYGVDAGRRHRWIRGDWQIAAWLMPRVPTAKGRQDNSLSWLSRWKIFDNLRRGLLPLALLGLLLLGWTVLAYPWAWSLGVLAVYVASSLIAGFLDLTQNPGKIPLPQQLRAWAQAMGRRLAQPTFNLACLPFEAIFHLDAILRATGRLLFTHRRLLEWEPSADQKGHCNTLAGALRLTWSTPLIALSAAATLIAARPQALPAALPFLALWLASPLLSFVLSRRRAPRHSPLTPDERKFLGLLSRKTWSFFEDFVGAQDHWLPPDNFQEYRIKAVAHRSSPTNMGLTLLANLSAFDLGYITLGSLLQRSANTLETMRSLERFHGHFYNWYDTLTLKPLPPEYVSSVDSGNLAGHLLTLRQGLLALCDQPSWDGRGLRGFPDTLAALDEACAGLSGELLTLKHEFEAAAGAAAPTPMAERHLLERLAEALGAPEVWAEGEARRWAQALRLLCASTLEEMASLAPLLALRGHGKTPTLRTLADQPGSGHDWARARLALIADLAQQAGELAQMDLSFLYDKPSRLLCVGYNVQAQSLDSSFYDLLASEARLCNFVGIALGQLPQESWFALGRSLARVGGEPILLSWSGSMFEYLMPMLVMPSYSNTLLDQTCRAAVRRQIDYGDELGLAWGISESGYNAVNSGLSYQYRGFGVPGLGIKRGLAEDLVIAPYATVLALMVEPQKACANLRRLTDEGMAGAYGLYEAVDHTPSRQRRGESRSVIRSYMAHHQGMSLLALAQALLGDRMQRRFAADPQIRATLLLLQEKIPHSTLIHAPLAEPSRARKVATSLQSPVRFFNSPDTPRPQLQLLSNGRYHVMVTQAGGGYSRWKDLAVTRWSEDGTRDHQGSFCYLKDLSSGEIWSSAHQPTLKRPKSYEAIFSEGRAEFRRLDGNFETHTEIAVSTEDDIELRRVRVSNRSQGPRSLEVTSYAELALAPPAADAAHPAFSKLFVETEILEAQQAILASRRPRVSGEARPWYFHLMAVHGPATEQVWFESDRKRFIGRGRSLSNPRAMRKDGGLSGSQGPVLDPIASLRTRVTIEAGSSAIFDIVSGMAPSREAALELIEKYRDRRLADRVFELAWTHGQVILRQIDATEADAQDYNRLAGPIVFADAALRAGGEILTANRRGQSGLWGYAISGDLPIVLLRLREAEQFELLRRVLQAHAYWRLKGLAVDLVIWNDNLSVYRQELQERILDLVTVYSKVPASAKSGEVFVRPGEQISSEDRILLQSAARVILSDRKGSLAEQLSQRGPILAPLPPALAHGSAPVLAQSPAEAPDSSLIFNNGLGGFTPDGREYVITLQSGQSTPAPWVNVLANPQFGTVVSESGLAHTFGENAHEFRLTPWDNDPIADFSGEALYLRDEDNGRSWSPSPGPRPGVGPYRIRHGFGYSVFEHLQDGIRSELWVYVAVDAPVKFSMLKLFNESGRPRRVSAIGYVEWVLGELRAKTAMHISSEADPISGALFARNRYNSEFSENTAFFNVDASERSFSCDRVEFIGRNGSIRDPAALGRARLSNRTGAALDPCAAFQAPLDLPEGAERQVVFTLGMGKGTEEAEQLAGRFRGAAAAQKALEAVWWHWNEILGAVQVETPDKALNVMANGWLVYQTLSSRLWGRSAFYQSGGAFGFRDQLQDVSSLLHTCPALARQQLLLCASRQFVEGDVQHWWHPPSGRGVRTRCSDDYLWLPWAASRYALSSGDNDVWGEKARFLRGRALAPGEDSYYDQPASSEDEATLYEHCKRAVIMGLRLGTKGLPLMGSGDWNDGMDRVGREGQGESVWLGFFLHDVLRNFAKVARSQKDPDFSGCCLDEAATLRQNLERNGWDGAWYRRAYFDDGRPLGSSLNEECQIDSIAQSWSVLSGAASPERGRQAMDSMHARLLRPELGLLQLLDPPFDHSDMDPGYIRGYVPGARENGGQYTHATIWAAMAFAAQGDRQRAWQLAGMLNPVNHASSPEKNAVYQVEPYVVAADIHAKGQNAGRGGWSWYTGSAGWMYQLITGSLLGLRLEDGRLHFEPCLPADWERYVIHYRFQETHYHITILQITQPPGPAIVSLDGVVQEGGLLTLSDDHKDHFAEVRVSSGGRALLQ